jgi:glycosyltransferase involved in cell wall biosynthesis
MSCDVLIVSNLYPPMEIGGYEIAAKDVANELVNEGLSVNVLTSDYRIVDFSLRESQILRTLKLIGSWYGDYRVGNRLENERHNYNTTARLLDSLNPKVLYAWNQANLGAGPLIAAAKRKIPILHHIMGVDLLTEIYNRKAPLTLLKKVIRTCLLGRHCEKRMTNQHIQNAIFLSRFLKNHYEQHQVIPDLSRVIHPGIRVENIHPKSCYEIHGETVEIVYVGQLAPHKGILEIKEAIHSLGENFKVRLTLIGDGEKHYVNKILDGARFPILHKGWLGRDIIFSQLHDFNIGIFSSTWDEPFGIAQIEMMAAGLPVISSGTGGSIEAVSNNENGILYDSRNPGDLAKKLAWLISEYSTHAARIGKQARETAQTEFSAARMSKEIRNVLNEISYKSDYVNA